MEAVLLLLAELGEVRNVRPIIIYRHGEKPGSYFL